MEVKKPLYFILATLFLVIAMLAITFKFSQHPMGADFTTFETLTKNNIDNAENLIDKRVAIRGLIIAPKDMVFKKIENFKLKEKKDGSKDKQKIEDLNIIGYIRFRSIPTKSGKIGVRYEKFKTRDFSISFNGVNILVKGQPQQIISPKDILHSSQKPYLYWNTIRLGKEYSIFGTLKKSQGKVILVPYLVNSMPIEDIKKIAAEQNKKINFSQYVLIFITVFGYIIFLWQAEVFSNSDEEREYDKKEQTIDKDEVS